MRFSSLGSGSEGNALLVEASDGVTTTRVLLDCGFSAREARRRLERIGVSADTLNGILITHEHADHIGSAMTLARKHAIPMYMSWGTARAVGADTADGIELHICSNTIDFAVGDLSVRPYTVPHDAREPLQFVFSSGARRLGVLTDAGSHTAHITSMLSGCDALVLECNHDRDMLANSRYHAALKARIGGSHGHLSNDTAASILATLDTTALQHIVAAHLSRENNQAILAQQAIADVLNVAAEEVTVATQEEGFAWRSV